MQNSPSVTPDTPVPAADNGASEATPSSPLITRRFDRAGLWSALPIALFCGVALSLRAPSPEPQSLAAARAVEAMQIASVKQSAPVLAIAGVVEEDQTMITAMRPANGYATLRGQLAPAVQVRGEAPIGGRVRQVMVRTGQRVRVGDPILRVEGKVKASGSRVAQRRQNAAEAAQVAAARQQEALQQKLATREEKLKKAQLRVASAQKRVELARAVVRRLARGENVTRADAAGLATPQLATRLASRGALSAKREKNVAREAEERQAEQEARQAKREAARALAAAEKAKSEAQSAAKLAQAKKQALKDAQAQLAKAEEQAAKDEAKKAEVESAKNAVKIADTAAQEATTKAEATQKIAATRDAETEKLRVAANAADKKLAQAQAEATPAPAPVPSATLSADDAAQMAGHALEESAAAVAEANKLKREIDSYARQVNSLHARLTSASNNLESAQMEMVESKIAEKLESVRAPASGVVLDVAETSSHVAPGETIIAIGRPDLLQVRFEDQSDAWKTLKTGAFLPAIVQPQGAKDIPVMAELREVVTPKKAGEAAILITTIENPLARSGRGRRFQTGLKVACSIPKPGAREALSVPTTALLREANGQNLVAVLSPIAQPESAPEAAQPNPADPNGTQTEATQTEATQPVATLFRVEWRAITPGQADGMVREIVGGLRPGERIALRPEPLRQLTQTHGPDAVVKLSA